MTPAVIGKARESGRAVFLVESERIEDLPRAIAVPCSRFVLLLAYDHDRKPARLVEALSELLDRGCVYLCAWGPGCEHVHDTMDDVALERALKGGPDHTIMTTWHHGQLLEEAIDFTLRHAHPDDALAPGCDAIVLAAVGDPAWTQALRSGAQKYIEPAVL